MIVDPSIEALRGDPAPQRHAQEAMQAAKRRWRKVPGAEQLLSDLVAFGKGAPLGSESQLAHLFTEEGEGERLMLALSDILCSCMADHPLAHPPLRIGMGDRVSTLQLARSGRAQLLIQTLEPGVFDRGNHVVSDGVRYDAILGGEAQGRIVRLVETRGNSAHFSSEPATLKAGATIALDMSSESFEVDVVSHRLVTLRLIRTAEDPAPTREYCAEDGRLLHQSAGNLATSRQEAIVTLLGRMGRVDAVPALALLATGEGDPSLRWQALRECLALDTATGFGALLQLARNPEDPLAREAGALRAQLIETYPALAQWEDTACPA